MKAVATVLVLIGGAAIVLWYGNTLNSWVLGGLIGGFGALLLSIPISIVLFSWISRHYNDHLHEEILEYEEDVALAQRGSYAIAQDQSFYDNEYLDYKNQEFYSGYDEDGVGEDQLDVDQDEYLLPDRSIWEEELPHRIPTARQLPLSSSARLSAVDQDSSSRSQRDTYNADPERPLVRNKKSGSRPIKSSTSSTYSYSHYRSQALHAARREAALQAEYTEEKMFFSTGIAGLEHTQRSNLSPNEGKRSRPSRYMKQQPIDDYSQRTQRVIDSLPPQNNNSRQPLSDDVRQADRFVRGQDDIHETATASPYRPLIRRAPYMYDDDPLREEMAQYTQRPTVRRSSRYLKSPSVDDIR